MTCEMKKKNEKKKKYINEIWKNVFGNVNDHKRFKKRTHVEIILTFLNSPRIEESTEIWRTKKTTKWRQKKEEENSICLVSLATIWYKSQHDISSSNALSINKIKPNERWIHKCRNISQMKDTQKKSQKFIVKLIFFSFLFVCFISLIDKKISNANIPVFKWMT